MISIEASEGFREMFPGDDIPLVELHIHIEGTLKPDLLLRCAARNHVQLPDGWESEESIQKQRRFSSLQSFLDQYYQGLCCLQTTQDYYELMRDYLVGGKLRRAEIFFDPQAHLSRGLSWETFMGGFLRAIEEQQQHTSVGLIMCFLRHESPADALQVWNESAPWRKYLIGVGLDSSERDYPPVLFKQVFAEARAAGLNLVAHAGEEGPPAYVWEALDQLQVKRIDHGIRSLEDPDLVARLCRDCVPLTVCPLSNVALCAVPTLKEHPLRKMLALGLCVCVNSDDPAYFGGDLRENFRQCIEQLGLTHQECRTLCRNAITASFASEKEKTVWMCELDKAVFTF